MVERGAAFVPIEGRLRSANGLRDILVAKADQGSTARAYLYTGGATFTADKGALPAVKDFLLRFLALFPGQEKTYTCVPRGSGRRIGIDRDADGVLDGDERRF